VPTVTRRRRTAAEPFREGDFREEDRGYTVGGGQPSPCRVWQRGKTKGGYGSMNVGGTNRYPHRVAAALAVRDGKLAKLTREQVEEIKRRVGEGETQAALAHEFGVVPGTVSKLLHSRPPKLRRARVVLTDEQKLDIWHSRREGETLRSIGARNGVASNYVIEVMRSCPSRQGLRDAAREVLRALSESWESLDAPWPVDRIDAARALGPDGPLDARQRVLAFRVLVEGRSLRVAGAEYGLKASSAARLLYDAAGLVAEYLWPRHWRAAR